MPASRFLSVSALAALTLAGAAPQPPTRPAPPQAPHAAAPSAPLLPPAPWAQADPADSIYRAARAALNGGDYARAARLFHSIPERYARSAYAPDALYWEAFALYRSGGSDDLHRAESALVRQREAYPKAATRGDADALLTRVRGALARLGDADAAASVTREATAGAGCATDDDNDLRVAALNALLQMDADRALPVLRQVLARRDSCSAPLRRKAVFLVSQKRTPETEDILTGVARNDPDPEVREQAVFWLSQVPTDKAVSALEDVLRTSRDPSLREKALFALSQHSSPRASELLRSFAQDDAQPQDIRSKAIFWIGQRSSAENARFLRALFTRLQQPELKERTLFALSQMSGEGNERWLLDIARDGQQAIEVRKKALFWAGQSHALPAADLAGLYDSLAEREMKEQMIFVLAQRPNGEGLDKLIDIARHDQDVELRKKAIFWLSQSHDPRVVKVLQDIIGGGQ